MSQCDAKDDLLKELINAGLLPKYAFPVDVVSLSIPSQQQEFQSYEAPDNDIMQRDLKIALSEYAPGAEVIRGSFPHTYIYRSVGIDDPFNKVPDYGPTGILIECNDCQAVDLIAFEEVSPDQCLECQSLNVIAIPYLRPQGFTVDSALPDAGREF